MIRASEKQGPYCGIHSILRVLQAAHAAWMWNACQVLDLQHDKGKKKTQTKTKIKQDVVESSRSQG